MIFNSISKEMTSKSNYSHNHNPLEYRPTTQQSRLSSSRNMISNEFTEPSALSQMNQKIVNNLDYLRHKDTLRSSRVSLRSNRS
jgi:hypothetical protein